LLFYYLEKEEKMGRIEIAPGAHITALPGEKFKKCRVNICLVLPGERETATALAVLPHILERRCEAVPDPIALSRKLNALYGAEVSGDSYALGANRVVSVGVAGLKNEYALAGEDLESAYVQLACQMLFEPRLASGTFEAEDVAIEAEKQADYLKSEMNDKRLHCLQQARRKLYGDSPLGLESAGYLEDIERVTPKALYEAYADLLARAQVEVSVFGMPAENAARQVVAYLAKAPRKPVGHAAQPPAPNRASFEHYEEPMDTVQGKLCLVYTSGLVPGARDAAVMRVAGAIFGGLPTSRLFMNVREKQSLCYYCASSYTTFGGTLTVDSGVEHKNLQRAADAVMHELEVLQTELATEEELDNAKRALHSSFTGAADSPAALESWAFTEQMRGTNLSIDEYDELVQSVSREEVRQALARFKPALQYGITQKEVQA
jgi:predicted Zn-dependent peptidase